MAPNGHLGRKRRLGRASVFFSCSPNFELLLFAKRPASDAAATPPPAYKLIIICLKCHGGARSPPEGRELAVFGASALILLIGVFLSVHNCPAANYPNLFQADRFGCRRGTAACSHTHFIGCLTPCRCAIASRLARIGRFGESALIIGVFLVQNTQIYFKRPASDAASAPPPVRKPILLVV